MAITGTDPVLSYPWRVRLRSATRAMAVEILKDPQRSSTVSGQSSSGCTDGGRFIPCRLLPGVRKFGDIR